MALERKLPPLQPALFKKHSIHTHPVRRKVHLHGHLVRVEASGKDCSLEDFAGPPPTVESYLVALIGLFTVGHPQKTLPVFALPVAESLMIAAVIALCSLKLSAASGIIFGQDRRTVNLPLL